MSIDLSPDVWNEFQRQLATGVYATPDEFATPSPRFALAKKRC